MIRQAPAHPGHTVPPAFPAFPDLRPRLRDGVLEFPVHHMRGGTSTGLVLAEAFAPEDVGLKEELLRHLMGVPLQGRRAGNRQITGLGRGPATSNKVFFAGAETGPGGVRLVSTLAQLASEHGEIDWSVNCGNMSSALPLWALDTGLLAAADAGAVDIDIRNTNTGVVTTARMVREADGRFSTAEIPGVDGAFASVDLFLNDPVGAKTGRLLPTGAPVETVGTFQASCVDVAVPMVILDAAEFGKTAHESVAELEADGAFMAALRGAWVEAGLRMGLKRRDGTPMSRADIERSETIPKACIVGAPSHGGHIAVRYFTPQTGHASMAVSGGCCLAAAALIEGTVAHRVARGLPRVGREAADVLVGIENPAGLLEATVAARLDDAGALRIARAAYRRSAQVLLRGQVPLYRASAALVEAVLSR